MGSKREIARRCHSCTKRSGKNRLPLTGSCALIIWPSVATRNFARSNRLRDALWSCYCSPAGMPWLRPTF